MRFCLILAFSGMLFALAPRTASAEVFVTVDKTAQRMSVSVNGEERYSWPVSTGVSDHDTPSGDFRPFRMERDHFSKEWDDAPMPYSIFFTGEGHAIHGTSHVRQLGRPASHGCVRLSKGNAATLFALVKAEGLGKAHVVIEGDTNVASDLMGDGVKIARQKAHHRPGREDPEQDAADGNAASASIRGAHRELDSMDYDYNIGGM